MRNLIASAFALLGIGLGLGVPIYWWITYSGLYRWLAEVQLGWFDGYYAILTGVLSLAAGCIAFLPVCIWLASVIQGPVTEALLAEAEAEAAKSMVALTPQQAADRAARGKALGCLGLLSVVIIPVVIMGVWSLWQASQFGPKRTLDLAALEAGAEPPSRWVDFTARPDWSAAAGIKEKHVVTRYVPVRSAPGQVAAVAIKMKAKTVSPGRTAWTGTLSAGAPGVVVSAFARRGGVREPVWVLDVDATPDSARSLGWSMLEVAGGMLLIGLIVIGVLRAGWRRVDA